jgi:2-polyprenyl-3-methyl-5-hydroxy-6-metoxy-1,4-benzoquinol methylase
MEKNKDSMHQKLFENYHETRSVYLDNSDQEKLTWFRFYYTHMYKTYFKNVAKDAAILDLGCNKGYLLKTLETEGYTDLTGVDLSKKDLEIAASIVPQAAFIADDIFDFLLHSQQKFDVILLKAVIEHVEKSRVIELLQLMSSRLSPTGFVLIDVYNADWLFSHHDRYMDFTHETGFTQESLRQVMMFAFKGIEIYPTASPIDFSAYNASKLSSFKESLRYNITRKIVRYIVGSIEPELKEVPFLERLLIGIGKNNV